MPPFAGPLEWIIGGLVILSSLGMILVRNPVHAGLFFLSMIPGLSILYLRLYAQFIGVMQLFVYAGAILVIFMFVIILFQDAYREISLSESRSSPVLLIAAGAAIIPALILIGNKFIVSDVSSSRPSTDFGSVQALGRILYVDYFFPFEAVTWLFLVAVVGALYVAKKG